MIADRETARNLIERAIEKALQEFDFVTVYDTEKGKHVPLDVFVAPAAEEVLAALEHEEQLRAAAGQPPLFGRTVEVLPASVSEALNSGDGSYRP